MAETFSFEEAKSPPPGGADQVDPSFTMEDMLHAAVDARKGGVDTFLAPRAGGGQVLMTPERAAGVASYIPTSAPAEKKSETFSFEDAQGPQPEQKKPEGKGFWAKLTEGGVEGMLKESLPAELSARLHDAKEANAIFQAGDEWNKERARRIAAGQSTNGMENWKLERINEIIRANKPADAPTPSATQIWDGIKKAAVADPGGFVGQIARGFITHPELLMTPEALPARAVEMGGKIAKIGVETAQIGGAVGAESILAQNVATGTSNPSQTGVDVAMTAAPIVAAHALLGPKAKAQRALAVDLGVAKAADEGVPKEIVPAVIKELEKKVEAGVHPVEAVDQVLEAMGVTAKAKDTIVNEVKEISDAKGNESGPVLPEAQGKEGEGVGGGDMPALDRTKPEDRQAPPVEEKVAPVVVPKAFHGTNKEFSEFGTPEDIASYRKMGLDMDGTFFFTDEPSVAATYAEGEGGNIRPSELRMKNPLTVDAGGKSSVENIGGPGLFQRKSIVHDAIGRAVDEGKDGVIITNFRDPMSGSGLDQKPHTVYVAFKRDQINSAIKSPKKEAEVIRPQQFTPLPEGLQKRMVTPEETFAVLKEAGIDEEAAKGMAGNVPIAIGALRQRLTKFMGGQKYADSVLADVLLNKQAGKVDPRLLGAMAAVGLGAAGAYALTEDKSKAIQTAMWLGATAAAVAAAGRVGRSVRSMFDRMQGDKTLKPMGPFNEYLKRPAMVEYAVSHWEKTTDALLTGIADKDAARIRVRDALQGHTDVKLTPQEQAYAHEVRKFLDTLGNMAHDAGTIERLRENYLTGLYQKKPFKAWKDVLRELTTEEAFRGNYTGMSRNSRFNLQKTIPDYRTAERLHAEGKFPLIPLTNDPVKIAGMYARSVQKTIAVDKLITDLKNTPGNRFWATTGIPVPVIIGMKELDGAKIVKANAETGRHLALDPEGVKAMDKFAPMDARTDYVMVRHPSLNGLLVHKDVAPMLKMLFDTSDPTMIHRALYSASMGAKALFFTISFFHPVSLGVVAATLALPRVRSIAQIPKYWGAMKEARAMLRNGDKAPAIAQAAEAGLEFMRAPQDMDPNIVSRVLNYAEQSIGPLGLPLKGMRVVNDWVQNWMWNQVFPTLKLGAFNAELNKALLKDPKADPKVVAHQIAQGVNDMFGGQNWFHMANDAPTEMSRRLAQAIFSPYGRRVQQIMFLAPDWNISAARSWYEGLKSVVPGIERKASDSMYRNYLVWSGMTYLGAANMLSNVYTGHNIWDQKDWTYVDRGDGTKVQLNKHFMEMAHLVMAPQKFFFNKLNLIPKEVIDQFFGKQWVSFDEKKGLYGPPMDQYPFGLTRPVHAAKTFIPLSIANIIRDPGAGISGMFSIGVYGTPYEQREEAAWQRAAEKGKDVGAARAAARKRREKERASAFKSESRVIP